MVQAGCSINTEPICTMDVNLGEKLIEESMKLRMINKVDGDISE